MADLYNIQKANYLFLNATDIKEFIILNLENSDNPAFKDVRYAGSNMNAFIDTLAVIFLQLIFHFSLNTSESTFSSALLYESINKLVAILNYKTIGKQTSMLPVKITISNIRNFIETNINKIVIPRFLTITHNSTYVLKNEIVREIDDRTDTVYIDAVMFLGSIQSTPFYTALGDEYETYILEDNAKNGNKFITDNFFMVFVKDPETEKYTEYTETNSLFLEDERATVYEKRFNENQNYEFKFGNGVYGKKLKKGSLVVIFYVLSSGESGIISDGLLEEVLPTLYESALYDEIVANLDNHTTNGISIDASVNSRGYSLMDYIKVSSFGPSTAISYPESVESMKANAPKIFASQNRLFSLQDYRTFIMKNFGLYCKDVFMCNNLAYTKDFLSYYYNIGLDAPLKDARINLSQVEFQTACNFNNVYAFILPKVNTVISGKVPNYLNTTIKQEIVNECEPYKGMTHNIVPMDPIYKAISFGSLNLVIDDYNPDQLNTKLMLVRDRYSKFSYQYIKDKAIEILNSYFDSLMLGDSIDISFISKSLLSIPGIKSYYMKDVDDNRDSSLTFYVWNPLYSNEDNFVTQQSIPGHSFEYYYFYDKENIDNMIIVEDE